jgi:hypothetical protein
MAQGYRASWKSNKCGKDYWGRLKYLMSSDAKSKRISHRRERASQRSLQRKERMLLD